MRTTIGLLRCVPLRLYTIKIRSRVSEGGLNEGSREKASKKNRTELETRINISRNDESIIGAKLMIVLDS